MMTIYENGRILTMDESYPEAEAMAVKDGRIEKIGRKADMEAYRAQGADCVDLQGKTALPGFLDGHSHFAGLAMSLSQCDLSKARNFEDICRLMKDFIEENHIPEGEWVTGTNYDHNFLEEKRHPDRFLLDQISQKHPMVLVHASSHMGVVNSLGLKLQGLNKDTKDPKGGRYGRMADSEDLNGYMEENAFVQLRNSMPMPKIDSLMELFRKAQKIYAGYGITTVQEGMVTPPLLQLLKYAQAKHVLQLDLVGYLDMEGCRELLRTEGAVGKEYEGHLRLGGCKIFLDGSPQGRTAWLKEPYQGDGEGYRGYPILTDEQLYQRIYDAVSRGRQLLAHCNGDAAAEQYLTQFERVLADHPECSPHRPVMIHAQLVQTGQLERMKALEMMPSFFVAHTYYWGDIHVENLGLERAKTISPAGTALRLGLPFTFHQDSPVLPPNVLESIWCGAKRVTRGGRLLSREERVSVYEGLKAATVYAAWQYGEEKDKGSLTEGKLADFIILNENPLEAPLDRVKDIKVLAAFKEGACVYCRKEQESKK